MKEARVRTAPQTALSLAWLVMKIVILALLMSSGAIPFLYQNF